jgi:hypothetical protein
MDVRIYVDCHPAQNRLQAQVRRMQKIANRFTHLKTTPKNTLCCKMRYNGSHTRFL